MMTRNLIRVGRCGLALLLGICAAVPGQATIDFEDVAVGTGVNDIGGDRVSGGYTFDALANHTHLTNDFLVAFNGTTYLVADDFEGDNPLTMSKVAGGAFSLTGFDLAEWGGDPTDYATVLDLTGNLWGGGQVFASVGLDSVADAGGALVDFQPVALGAAWGNLASVEFKGSGSTTGDDYFALDNLQVGAAVVPEPGTLALLGCGLVGMVKRRKRR